jgi:hypothetical protein
VWCSELRAQGALVCKPAGWPPSHVAALHRLCCLGDEVVTLFVADLVSLVCGDKSRDVQYAKVRCGTLDLSQDTSGLQLQGLGGHAASIPRLGPSTDCGLAIAIVVTLNGCARHIWLRLCQVTLAGLAPCIVLCAFTLFSHVSLCGIMHPTWLMVWKYATWCTCTHVHG